MKPIHHILIAARLVPVVLALWWLDLREPGTALARVREAIPAHPEALRRGILHGAVAAWCLAWAAILWGGATLPAALVAAGAGTYSLIAATVRDRLEAL